MHRLAWFVVLIIAGQSHADRLIIKQGRIIDGTGQVLQSHDLAIRDGKIVEIGAAITSEAADTVLDAKGKTVMPGMIETHVHLLLVDRSIETTEELDEWADEELPEHLTSYLTAGVTTALSTGDHTNSIVRVKRRIAAGELSGPRLLVSGAVFTAPGGHPATTICRGAAKLCREQVVVEVDDIEVARARVRELANADVDAIKAVYQASPAGAPKLKQEVLAAIADEAHANGLPLIVHAPIIGDALVAIEHGADRLVHPPIRGRPNLRPITRALLEHDVPFATTFHQGAPVIDRRGRERNHGGNPFTPRMRLLMDDGLQAMRTLWDAGAVIAFGTDRFLTDPGDEVAHEIETLNRVFSPAEVIAALTKNAALFLGLENELGTLEAGKLADVVIIDGDPLTDVADLANVEVVVQNGKIVVDNR